MPHVEEANKIIVIVIVIVIGRKGGGWIIRKGGRVQNGRGRGHLKFYPYTNRVGEMHPHTPGPSAAVTTSRSWRDVRRDRDLTLVLAMLKGAGGKKF